MSYEKELNKIKKGQKEYDKKVTGIMNGTFDWWYKENKEKEKEAQ